MASSPAIAQSDDRQANPGSSRAAANTADQPVTTLSVHVKVVNVLAAVRDKHGNIVNNLTKDDFTLTEDGRPQVIKYFSRETDLPLTLGMLVDTSMSQRRVLTEERDASETFLAQVLREDQDKAFVIHFDREVELSQDLTASHEKLRTALESLETPRFTRASQGGGNPDPILGSGGGRGSGRRGGGTLLYDAVFLASDEMMQKQPGRKALIVLSDGVDMGSKESLESAIESAQRANTIVYSILFKDDEAYGNGGGGLAAPASAFPAWADREWDAAEWVADAAVVAIRKSTPTARKCWSESPRKPADACSKFPRKSRSNKFIPALRKSCAINTTWATHLTGGCRRVGIPQDSGGREKERPGDPGERRILREQIASLCFRCSA